MPAIQAVGSYATNLAPGLPGQIADMRNRTIRSLTSQSATPIAFGAPVFQGAGDDLCLGIGDQNRGAFLGLSVIDPAVRPMYPDAYGTSDTVGVMLKGPMFVTVSGAVTPGQPAFYTPAGLITSAASGNTGIPGAAFETTAASGGIARLKVG